MFHFSSHAHFHRGQLAGQMRLLGSPLRRTLLAISGSD
ncbi:hypothetical protein [Meiothermus sp.]